MYVHTYILIFIYIYICDTGRAFRMHTKSGRRDHAVEYARGDIADAYEPP